MLARLAASIFCRMATVGDRLNIGTGLPEEVCSGMGSVVQLIETGIRLQFVPRPSIPTPPRPS